MSWDAIAAVAEITSALVVLVTLVFLARQIRQSNRIAQGEAERVWFLSWHEVVASTTADLETTQLYKQGLHSFSSLDDDQKAMFHTILVGMMDRGDALNRLHRQGLVSTQLLNSIAGLFSLSMFAAFLFGYSFHFVIDSPDSYSNVVGEYASVFFHSALNLAILEFVGFVFGAYIWLVPRHDV